MVAFEGRSKDTLKLKNKPIDTGYKLWCIGDHGYIWSWLYHSRETGVETFTQGQKTSWQRKKASESTESSISLAPTFALVLRLAEQLPKQLEFYVNLDNLFLMYQLHSAFCQWGSTVWVLRAKRLLGCLLSFKSILLIIASCFGILQ